jgi:hypothetical protein
MAVVWISQKGSPSLKAQAESLKTEKESYSAKK